MQELDLELFGDATRLILGVIGLIRLKGACRQFTLEVLGQAGDWIRFDQIGITIVQDFGVHDFGGDCRRVFLILGSVWCGGCGISDIELVLSSKLELIALLVSLKSFIVISSFCDWFLGW